MAHRNLSLNKNAFWVKPVIIFILLLVMLIPLGFIKSILYERQMVKQEAESSIMRCGRGFGSARNFAFASV